MAEALNLAGQRFGMLVAVDRLPDHVNPNGKKIKMWRCQCDCGNENEVSTSNLRQGFSQSCGCTRGEFHGMCRSAEYSVWMNMFSRCTNPNNAQYKNYGGRGISVCERWSTFGAFFEDMGRRPSDKHTLDRENNELGYSKANCRWVIRRVQANNTRRNRRFAFGGKTLTVMEWHRETGVPWTTMISRLNAGWPPEQVLHGR